MQLLWGVPASQARGRAAFGCEGELPVRYRDNVPPLTLRLLLACRRFLIFFMQV